MLPPMSSEAARKIDRQADLARRNFLKLGLGGSLLLAAGGGIFGWRIWSRGYDRMLAPGDTPLALSAKEFAIAKRFVQALLPGDDGFPAGDAIGIPQRIDEEVWAAPPELASDLKSGLLLLEHATLWSGYSSRFTALAPAQQREYLSKLLAGDNNTLCLIAIAFKQMAHLFYYGHPAVWQRIGYDGPLVEKAAPPDSAITYQALLRGRA